MTDTPTLNGQIIGQAERATRAVLDVLLAETGTDFVEWVTLNVLHGSGASADASDLVARVGSGLKIDGSVALESLRSLIALGLVAGSASGSIELTDAGRSRHEQIRAGIATISSRLYRDLPQDDLATAGRVLTLITARANAELAG